MANASFAFGLGGEANPAALAPLLCIGLYGFGAAAHSVAQVYPRQERGVYAFTQAGDRAAQRFANMGARIGQEATRCA